MNEDPDRPRFIERQEPAATSEEARHRRAATMLGIGVIALLWSLVILVGGGQQNVGLLIGIVGAGLLVGGLVMRS